MGDLALIEQDGRPVPGVAPAANQMGAHAARNIVRAVEGQPHAAFRYVDKGSLATIGRRAGVADFGRFQLWGAPAWLAWLAIHIFFLIGFRNRLVVMLDWALAYLTYQRHARLLLGPRPRSVPRVRRDARPGPDSFLALTLEMNRMRQRVLVAAALAAALASPWSGRPARPERRAAADPTDASKPRGAGVRSFRDGPLRPALRRLLPVRVRDLGQEQPVPADRSRYGASTS